MNCEFRFLVHGGAGVISKSVDKAPYVCALQRILKDTFEFSALSTATAVDIAEFAVKELENEPLFNAGKGAVYTADKTHELDASIMDGSTLSCGATSMIKTIKNPVSVARLVMERTDHVFIVGDSAERLAVTSGLEQVDQSYYHTEKRLQQLHTAQQKNVVARDHDLEGAKGTVGCVCMKDGHVAAATSTGGMTNKMPGRVGDTPVIGTGTYANDRTCAVSATGQGEEFIRHVAAYNAAVRMELCGQSVQEAVKDTVWSKLPAESGGLIAVDARGNYAMDFNCGGMFRGTCGSDGLASVGIWEENEPGELNFAAPV